MSVKKASPNIKSDCAMFHMWDIRKNVLPKGLYVPLRSTNIAPEISGNICLWAFLQMREFIAWGSQSDYIKRNKECLDTKNAKNR